MGYGSFEDGLLFHGRPLVKHLDEQRQLALASLEVLGPLELLDGQGKPEHAKIDIAVAGVDAAHRIQPVRLNFNNLSRTPLTENDGIMATSITVPFAGEPALLDFKLNHTSVGGADLRGTVLRADADPLARGQADGGHPHRLVFWLRNRNLGDEYKSLLAQRRQQLTSKIDFANRIVTAWNNELGKRLNEAALARADLLARMHEAEAAMTIPVTRATHPKIALPVRRRTLKPPVLRTEPTLDHTTDDQSWVLDQAVYDEVVRTLVLFAAAAGRLPASAGKLSENDLRNFALLVLNANFDFTTARGEVFNGDGKTDLLLPWELGNAFIGEFKKYDGADSVNRALSQLLTYVTWADTKAALVVIIDRVDVTAALAETHRAIEQHPRHHRTIPANDPDRRRDYIVTSSRDHAREVKLAVIPIVVQKGLDSPRCRNEEDGENEFHDPGRRG